jgi:hypothetical protein
MTFWGRCTGLAAAVVATACLNDPAAPAAYRLEVRPDTIRFVALRDTLRPLVLEHRGSTGPSPLFIGSYHILDTTIASVSATGLITSRAAGATRLLVRSPYGASDTAVVLVSQTVAQVRALRDTLLLHAINAVASIPAVAEDPLGSPIQGYAFSYAVADTSIATVSATGEVRARANGSTTVTVSGDQQSSAVVVHVVQQITQIATDIDTLHFTALGQTRSIVVESEDSLGNSVPNPHYQLTIGDTAVLQLVDSLTVRSHRYGTSSLRIEAGGRSVEQVAQVIQTPARVEATLNDTNSILAVAMDSAIPLTCRVLDGEGSVMAIDPQVLPSSAGRWTGSTCSSLAAHASGLDTLRFVAGTDTAVVPVVLAIPPVVRSVVPIVVDSLPPQVLVWAPTVRRNTNGQVEMYFAGYSPTPDSTGYLQANLYRLVSQDGMRFAYDGMAMAHDPSYCDAVGSGIENIDIVSRSDGPGWRMFFAGGSFSCYGWQVFSAISTDERTWTREPGVRISNGSSLPPDPPNGAPYPTGEGIVTEALPDGTWRMTVGGYEPVSPIEDKFQIVEWRSSDQLHWTYSRSVITTHQLPPEGQRSAYSPTITQIAPGLWRMFFTADDRDQPNGRSRIWSAVSVDRLSWQIEGQILGAPGVEYLYSTVLDNHLYSVQSSQGSYIADRQLVVATIESR